MALSLLSAWAAVQLQLRIDGISGKAEEKSQTATRSPSETSGIGTLAGSVPSSLNSSVCSSSVSKRSCSLSSSASTVELPPQSTVDEEDAFEDLREPNHRTEDDLNEDSLLSSKSSSSSLETVASADRPEDHDGLVSPPPTSRPGAVLDVEHLLQQKPGASSRTSPAAGAGAPLALYSTAVGDFDAVASNPYEVEDWLESERKVLETANGTLEEAEELLRVVREGLIVEAMVSVHDAASARLSLLLEEWRAAANTQKTLLDAVDEVVLVVVLGKVKSWWG